MAIQRFNPIRLHFGQSAKVNKYGGIADLRRQLNALEGVFKKFADHMTEQTSEVFEEALRPTYQKSQERVPKKTGALMRSGYLTIRRSGKRTQAEMGYGRNGSPHYALLVHELPVYHKPPTTWKFLENPIKEDLQQIETLIVAGLTKASGTGGPA